MLLFTLNFLYAVDLRVRCRKYRGGGGCVGIARDHHNKVVIATIISSLSPHPKHDRLWRKERFWEICVTSLSALVSHFRDSCQDS